MTGKSLRHTSVSAVLFALVAFLPGCHSSTETNKQAAEAPPAPQVVHGSDENFFHIANASQFPLATAEQHLAASTLSVTGTVNPDVSRTIPVISIANGRVLNIYAHLGDNVRKGQLLMEVQSTDVATAFDAYLKAVNDERLANTQLQRAQILYDKGATPRSQLEIAQTAEQDAQTDLTAARQQLHVLGVDPNHPSEAVKVYAPASGVIISQNVTAAAAAGVTLSGSSTAFTIADLSHVWVICDVYENDLAQIRLGQHADIHLNAYPGKVITGTISDIGAVLDPSLRTAKVRIQVDNPGMLMRIGMFVTAVLHGSRQEVHTSVPATAILHLKDRDWVYVPSGADVFRRIEVHAGDELPNGQQELISGLQPGQQVVAQALAVQNASAQ